MSDEKRKADALDAYLNHPDRSDDRLTSADKRIVDNLRQAATSEHPRPGFVNELAQQLREKDRSMNEKKTLGVLARLPRLALGGLAFIALIFAGLYAVTLFRAPSPEPAVEDQETRESVEVFEPDDGPFAGHRLEVAGDLDEGPAEAALFRIESPDLPDTVEGAIELGRALGMEDPQVYTSPQDPGRWNVRDDDSSLSYRPQPQTPGPPGLYYALGQWARLAVEGEPMPFSDAARSAIDFLQQGDLLPAEYDVSEAPWTGDTPLRLVEIHPLVDGLPIESDQATIQVGVLPDGEVALAQVNRLGVVPADETVTLKTARQALEELLEGRGGYSFSYENVASDAQRQEVYFPSTAPRQPGERATVNGWANVLLSVTGGPTLVELTGGPGGRTYLLVGQSAGDLAQAGGGQVQVEGVITEERENGELVLEVSSWEPASGPVASCQNGVLSLSTGTAVLQSDQGQTFDLGDVDPALQDGERIEVCAESFDEGRPLTWHHIAAPPSSEVARGGGGGGGGGSAGTVVQAVEVTRVIESSSAGGSESRQVAEQVVAGGGPASPYTVGDSINLSGVVGGFLQRQDDVLIPNLMLQIDEDDDPFTPSVSYPLYGSKSLLDDLVDHYFTYVSVEGQIVDASGDLMRGPQNQAIRIESFEPLEGASGMQAFLGRIEQQEVEGQEVTVFVDEEGGQRYVLTQAMHIEASGQRVWIAGFVHPQAELGGMPVLAPQSMNTGSHVDAAQSPEDIPMQQEIPVMDERGPSSPAGGLPQTMIVERVTLGYSLDAPGGGGGTTLTPTWLFYGHSPDEATTFVLQMSAVAQ